MQYTVTRAEKGKVEVKVGVPKAAFAENYSKVLDNLSKGLKIAGFRPGKIPADVAESHIGLTKLLNETASVLISKHLAEIFDKEKLLPVANPKIAVESLAKGSSFSFVATLYNKPKVKVSDWKKIKIKKIAAKEVTEQDISESIGNIYEAWEKQEESKLSQGLDVKEEEGEKFIYDAQGNKIFIKDDKKKEVMGDKSKIDDEFAKKVGTRDLAHLRELVRGDLEKIIADQIEAKFEDELFTKLLEVAEVEVPEILIEDELNRILLRLNSQLESQGKKLDDFLTEEKTTMEELKAKWREQAEKNVKATLIMDEVGQEEKVSVSREELDEALRGVNQTNLDPKQKADLERYLAVSIFQAKTLGLVKKAVTAA